MIHISCHIINQYIKETSQFSKDYWTYQNIKLKKYLLMENYQAIILTLRNKNILKLKKDRDRKSQRKN